MTPARRVGSAALLLTLTALNLACPGPPGPPPVTTCEGAPADADIAGLSGAAAVQSGAQGADMVVVDVEWRGAGAPECAMLEAKLIDARGSVVDDRHLTLATEATSEGRRSSSGFYFILDEQLCDAEVELTSYGHTVTLAVNDHDFYACRADAMDAGPDGGEDGGAADGGAADADIADAAQVDASATDASTLDASAADAGSDASTPDASAADAG